MAKPLFIILCSLAFWLDAGAQTLSPTILANDGGTAYTDNMVLEWTIGEPLIATLYSANQMYTEGFHQPVLQITSVFERQVDDYRIQVFPNPVEAYLTVRIESEMKRDIQLEVKDVNGRTIIREKISPPFAQFDLSMEMLPSALYLLRFSDLNGYLIQTFKISKIH